ncbi:hypothetical protein [Aromatoleum sp.]|uniref:hypothetical protein n=1 Tax=Aromatoleum sp. TaxID=2307007 RepID=UPI002FC6433F
MAADRGGLTPVSSGAAFISGPVLETFEREVSATPAQFERDLRTAWPAGVETVAPGHFRVQDGTTRLDLRVESRGVRRLGMFELPVIAVGYRFSGAGEPERARLLRMLDHAMLRGGG